MEIVLLALHVVAAVLLITLVLLQQGQGADAGAAFGSGASQTVFGSRGAGNFLTRLTTVLAATFMATSLILAYFSNTSDQAVSVTDRLVEQTPATGSTDSKQTQKPAPPVVPEIPD